MLTASLRRRIKASLEANPLEENEIRRIEGVGGYFLCRANAPLSDEYAALVTFDFAGDRITLARWLGSSS